MSTTDPSPWAPDDWLREATGRARWTAQARALARMGIPFTLSAQGRPLVERSILVREPKPQRKAAGPDWQNIKRRKAA